jgi:protein disulfide-isomerase A1
MISFADIWKNINLIIFLFFTIILFGGIAYYYYNYIVQPKLNKKYIDNKEFVSKEDTVTKNATLYFFYTNWCPHCKNARPEWDKLKTETGGVVNGVNIVFLEIDCENKTALADQFKVEGYPSIKLVYNNKIYDYDAKPSKENLIQFLNEFL